MATCREQSDVTSLRRLAAMWHVSESTTLNLVRHHPYRLCKYSNRGARRDEPLDRTDVSILGGDINFKPLLSRIVLEKSS
jgi:hypothetical protein